MESTQRSNSETYRAIVLGQSGNQLLLAPAANGFHLPSIEIPRWRRLAENMTVAIRNEWGQEAVCLFNLEGGFPLNYQVMESHGPLSESGYGAKWVHVASLSEKAFADPADYLAVERSLAECAGLSTAVTKGPFTKLGWLRELQDWIEEVIRPLGFRLTQRFSQLNASASFSLLRFETSGPAVWFKAVGSPNLREFPITLELARHLTRYLPTILGTRPAWHGWLALEVEGISLGETQDAEHWAAAASALAKLQIESVEASGVLAASGARDLRAPALLKLVRPFLDAMGHLMEIQPNVPPATLTMNELVLLGEQIEEALSLAADFAVPDSLGHLDLNPGNVILCEGECVFLDWAEAYVGSPPFSLQYLVEHFRRFTGIDAAAESRLIKVYTEAWQTLVSPERMAEALALAPMLAVFAYAVATDSWLDDARLRDPKLAGYLRSLTRRMHREANRLRNRSVLCRS